MRTTDSPLFLTSGCSGKETPCQLSYTLLENLIYLVTSVPAYIGIVLIPRVFGVSANGDLRNEISSCSVTDKTEPLQHVKVLHFEQTSLAK